MNIRMLLYSVSILVTTTLSSAQFPLCSLDKEIYQAQVCLDTAAIENVIAAAKVSPVRPVKASFVPSWELLESYSRRLPKGSVVFAPVCERRLLSDEEIRSFELQGERYAREKLKQERERQVQVVPVASAPAALTSTALILHPEFRISDNEVLRVHIDSRMAGFLNSWNRAIILGLFRAPSVPAPAAPVPVVQIHFGDRDREDDQQAGDTNENLIAVPQFRNRGQRLGRERHIDSNDGDSDSSDLELLNSSTLGSSDSVPLRSGTPIVLAQSSRSSAFPSGGSLDSLSSQAACIHFGDSSPDGGSTVDLNARDTKDDQQVAGDTNLLGSVSTPVVLVETPASVSSVPASQVLTPGFFENAYGRFVLTGAVSMAAVSVMYARNYVQAPKDVSARTFADVNAHRYALEKTREQLKSPFGFIHAKFVDPSKAEKAKAIALAAALIGSGLAVSYWVVNGVNA